MSRFRRPQSDIFEQALRQVHGLAVIPLHEANRLWRAEIRAEFWNFCLQIHVMIKEFWLAFCRYESTLVVLMARW